MSANIYWYCFHRVQHINVFYKLPSYWWFPIFCWFGCITRV